LEVTRWPARADRDDASFYREPVSAVLRLASVRKSVPGGRVLFDGLELDLQPGEHLAIRGESGVGKSTLLNLIAGLDDPDDGAIVVSGRELGELDEAARTDLRRDAIGFVFQAFHILPHLTLAQNIALPLLLQKRARGEALAAAGEMLAAVGLGDRRQSYPKELSGGEMQRVAIARALVHQPALILADEPTGNLDPETAAVIMDLLGRSVRERGAAMLLVTHSPAAAALADRTLLLTRRGLVDG
jgi:putative ABC transport system ATP-binding protein